MELPKQSVSWNASPILQQNIGETQGRGMQVLCFSDVSSNTHNFTPWVYWCRFWQHCPSNERPTYGFGLWKLVGQEAGKHETLLFQSLPMILLLNYGFALRTRIESEAANIIQSLQNLIDSHKQVVFNCEIVGLHFLLQDYFNLFDLNVRKGWKSLLGIFQYLKNLQ